VYALRVPPVTSEEKRRLISNVSLFAALSERDLDSLIAVARTTRLATREQLFHKGDHGTQVFVVIRGTLKALTTSEEGDDVVFSILGEGEVFGEVALLGRLQRTASVSAVTPCELLVIDRRDFLQFLRSHPDAAIELLTVLAERLTRVSELVEDTLFLNLPVRLAKKLVHLARTHGETHGASVKIDLKLSQEEWGDLVGATRESINKQLRSWIEAKWIELEHGYIVIHRLRELERLAGFMIA
jgi:CRP/FNR family transcriptional regulator, cyclic AMP receptor protein